MKEPLLPPCRHALVEIRSLLPADIPDWYAYLREPEVIQHTSWNLRDINDLYALYHDYQNEGPETPLRFAIAERARLTLPIIRRALAQAGLTAEGQAA